MRPLQDCWGLLASLTSYGSLGVQKPQPMKLRKMKEQCRYAAIRIRKLQLNNEPHSLTT